MKASTFALALLTGLTLLRADSTLAQTSIDTATEYMRQHGLFTAHTDYCDNSEVFVPTGPTSSLGICMEKDLRNSGGTFEWDVARRYCLDAGKRLPEPMEYKEACLNVAGLNNMPNSTGEWASNFTTHLYDANQTFAAPGLYIPTVVSNCRNVGLGQASGWNNVSPSFVFRCVR